MTRVAWRGGAVGLALALGVAMAARAAAPDVDMADVRRLAREPVETILAGAPVAPVTDADYGKSVHGSPKPVVVVFYASRDERSRNLATLVRYLALEFGDVVGFYAYRVSAGTAPDRDMLARIDQRYGVKRVPASLFYDNDRGPIELEKADYSVPLLTEYRTPSLLFWRTYHQAVRDYIRKSILD